jgi:hypothetical protein
VTATRQARWVIARHDQPTSASVYRGSPPPPAHPGPVARPPAARAAQLGRWRSRVGRPVGDTQMLRPRPDRQCGIAFPHPTR